MAKQLHKPLTRSELLNLTAVVEGGLVLFAALLAWVFGINLALASPLDWSVVGDILRGTAPLVVLLLLFRRWQPRMLQKIEDAVIQDVGPAVLACNWFDLLLISVLAGLGEEWLFRGVIQPLLQQGGHIVGWLLTSVLFGLVHPRTRGYVVLAAILGGYLGWLAQIGSEPSLFRPVGVHALYDLFALGLLRAEMRRRSLTEMNATV